MAARTTLVKTQAPGSYPTAGVTVTFAAADVTNKNDFTFTADEMVIARNTGSTTRTISISSAANSLGRVGDITTENILAGAYKVYGPYLSKDGWNQAGKILLEASNAEVEFAVIKLTP